MYIRMFKDEDANEVSNLIKRNLFEVNIKDYDLALMKKTSQMMEPNNIISKSSYSHIYVVIEDNKIIGTGSIAKYFGKEDEAILLSIFVLPELHKNGIGSLIINTLEKDDFFITSKRIEIPSSITAVEFYRKHGYDYKNGIRELDEEQNYRLEKYR